MTTNTEPTPAPYPDDALAVAARHHVLHLWNERHDARLVYHNFAQAAETAHLAAEIARHDEVPAETAAIVLLAAWFHNTGYLYDTKPAPETHAIRAELFLAEQHCPPDKIQPVRQFIVTSRS